MTIYIARNEAFSTGTATSAGTSYAAGSKVAIQLSTPSTIRVRIIEYGVSFNGTAVNTPGIVELVETNTTSKATVTTLSGLVLSLDNPNAITSRLTFGTTDTGYGAAAIPTQTPNVTRYLDGPQFVSPTNQFIKQFPLGREPIGKESAWQQLRINTSATVLATAYIMWEEL
jgi:hypothetical protein